MTPSFASAPPSAKADATRTNEFADARTVRVPRRFSVVFIRGFPPNKKTTRQRTKQGLKAKVR
jgi:hypothetical protein